MFGESAAIPIGRSGNGPMPESRNWEVHFAPAGGSSPRRIARTIAVYSRISVTGLSIVWPCQNSTTGRCETPMPSIIRPPEASWIVAASWAMVAGVRE